MFPRWNFPAFLFNNFRELCYSRSRLSDFAESHSQLMFQNNVCRVGVAYGFSVVAVSPACSLTGSPTVACGNSAPDVVAYVPVPPQPPPPTNDIIVVF
jgi:hypothetical protein